MGVKRVGTEKKASPNPSEGRELKNDKWERIGFVLGNGNSNSVKDYKFTDDKISNGKYSYRLKQVDNDGKFEYSKEIEVEVNLLPTEYALDQNFPNPFNPSTVIQYQIPQPGKVILNIYDMLGREVRTLVNEFQQNGTHSVTFDALHLSSGVYFYRIQSGSFIETKKMLLLK